jgi:hypothetical protein
MLLRLLWAKMSDAPHGDRNMMSHRNKLLAAFGLGVFAAVVLLVLSAYLNPAMLINLANLRLCT